MQYLALTLPGQNGTPYVINPPAGIPQGGLGSATGKSIVSVGIQLLLIGASILCLFYIIYGGYKWLSSSGDAEKLASARMTIFYAIIGLMLTFFSFLIMNVFGTFFGIPCILCFTGS